MILESHKKYYIEHLKEMGAKQELAQAIIELHIENGEQLATKHDLKDAKNELKGDITRLESKIGSIETNIRWLIGITLIVAGILLTPTAKEVSAKVAQLIRNFV